MTGFAGAEVCCDDWDDGIRETRDGSGRRVVADEGLAGDGDMAAEAGGLPADDRKVETRNLYHNRR